MSQLFDPDEYLAPGAQPREPRPQPPVPKPPVLVTLDDGWSLCTTRRGEPMAHKVVFKDPATLSVKTKCDQWMIPLTAGPDMLAPACPDC